MKKNAITPEPKSKHFLLAASLLVEKIKQPAKLLTFLSDNLYNYHEYSIENYVGKDKLDLVNQYSYIKDFVDHLVIPWMNARKDVINEIAEGIHEMYSFGGYSEYHDAIGYILTAHGFSFKSGIPTDESQKSDLSIIATLSEMGKHIRDHQEEDRQEKKKQAA